MLTWQKVAATDLNWAHLLSLVECTPTPWVAFTEGAPLAEWVPLPQVGATITASVPPRLLSQGGVMPTAALWQELWQYTPPFFGTYFDTLLLRRWYQSRLLHCLNVAGLLEHDTGPFLCWLVTLTHNGLVHYRQTPLTGVTQPVDLTRQQRWALLDFWNRHVLGHCT